MTESMTWSASSCSNRSKTVLSMSIEWLRSQSYEVAIKPGIQWSPTGAGHHVVEVCLLMCKQLEYLVLLGVIKRPNRMEYLRSCTNSRCNYAALTGPPLCNGPATATTATATSTM